MASVLTIQAYHSWNRYTGNGCPNGSPGDTRFSADLPLNDPAIVNPDHILANFMNSAVQRGPAINHGPDSARQ